MNTFHWDSAFLTGLHTVDAQHQHLVDLINRLGQARMDNQLQPDDLATLHQELVDYAQHHFRDEENLMKQAGIDPRHITAHVQAHVDFLQEVSRRHASAEISTLCSSRQLLDYLTHWLAFHILGQDHNMARQIAAVNTGATPAEAFLQEEKTSHGATQPLLRALNGLYTQLSARSQELEQLNRELEDRVNQRTCALLEANRQLEVLSLTDMLTGLPNRRHAIQHLEALWQESITTGKPMACMMVDADHFKTVNDTYGHDAGDRVLQTLARTLRHALRNDDIVCRLGGDEFLILCPATPHKGALYIAEQVRQNAARLRVPTGGQPWHGSVSIGVAVSTAQIPHHEALIKMADAGVYQAKQAGKNRIGSVQDIGPTDHPPSIDH
ncbi:hemerythrin [Ectothiorhodospira magna]|uniref:diguanylate cyclase n=1 Tax=Ectothiorhodospira magna TaxID=867345 RepID=A0A1H9FW55_9GAMM|nr:GGDEF domain-containing protein [Ectothiorhodospira magna]SEQ42132.1 hemerythrin [Ectothiorhodospira magna]